MPATPRSSKSAAASATSFAVTGAGLTWEADDVLFLFVSGYATVGMSAEGSLDWTEIGTGASVTTPFSTGEHRVYRAVATASIATWPTLSNGAVDAINYVLVAVQDADTTTPVDDFDFNVQNSAPSVEPTAPSVDPTSEDALLLCGAAVWPDAGGSTMTPPSGMTELQDLGSWDRLSVAYLALSASGATGTKQFDTTATGSRGAGTSSIAVKAAAGGTNATAIPAAIAAVASLPAASVSAVNPGSLTTTFRMGAP